MDIEIKTAGGSLVLPEDIAIRLTYRNMLFQYDSPAGSQSISFNISKAQNGHLFEHGGGFKTRNDKIKKEAELFYKGHKIKDVEITLKEAGTRTLNCSFVFDNGVVANAIKEKHLTDSDYYEELGEFPTSTMGGKINGSYPTDHWTAFPFKMNVTGVPESSEHYAQIINWWDPLGNGFMGGGGETNPIAPCWYLNFVLEKIFEESGFYVTDNYLANGNEYKNAVIINYNFEHKHFRIEDAVTEWWVTRLCFARDLPKITIGTFLKELKKKFNISYVFSNRQVKIIDTESMFSAAPTADLSGRVLITQKTASLFNGVSIGYNMRNGGDASTTDDEEEQYDATMLHDTKDGYYASVEDFSDLPTSVGLGEEVYLVRNENRLYYYYRTSGIDGEWYDIGSNHYAYKTGEKEFQVNSNISLLRMEDVETDYPEYGLLPVSNKSKEAPHAPSGWKNFTEIDIMLYRGVHLFLSMKVATLDDLPDSPTIWYRDTYYVVSEGQYYTYNDSTHTWEEDSSTASGAYPYANHNTILPNKTEHSSWGKSLLNSEPEGIFKQRFEKTAEFMQSSNVFEGVAIADLNLFKNLQDDQKYIINGQEFFIEELEITLTNNRGILPGKIKLRG